MLSFLIQIANEFEREHGYRPNVLYISPQHFKSLQGALSEIKGLEALTQFLGMEIVLSEESCQPHLAWSSIEWKRAVVV